MAKLPGAFNSNEHEDLGDYDALPAGEYKVRVKESKLVENSKKTGSLLKFKFEVSEGEFKGRLLFSNMNIIHENPKAVEIAQKELATLCRAAGRVKIEDSEDLHGCEVMVKVTQKPANAQYPATNEIKNYMEIKGLAQPSLSKVSSNSSAEVPKKAKVTFDD